MKNRRDTFPGIGLVFGTALGGIAWLTIAGAAPASIWWVGLGTALGLIIGAAARAAAK